MTAVFKNLTPHSVHVYLSGAVVEIPRSGEPARVVLSDDEPVAELELEGGSVQIVRTSATGRVVNLPLPQPSVIFIVARSVAEACPERRDLVFPHGAVRDERGVVIGCTSFGCIWSR